MPEYDEEFRRIAPKRVRMQFTLQPGHVRFLRWLRVETNEPTNEALERWIESLREKYVQEGKNPPKL